jgi:hypothetical protein
VKVETERIKSVRAPEVISPDGELRVRTPGLHLSQVIRYVARQSGMLKTEQYKFVGRNVEVSEELESFLDDKWILVQLGFVPLRMAIGMAWEDWAVKQYPEVVWQPAELSLDGIAMNPDGVTSPAVGKIGRVAPTLEEFKCTYKSSLKQGAPRPIQLEWMWLSQLKGYCKALETSRARLHVLYVNGGYRFDQEVPEYWVYRLQFSQQELDANWGLMVRHKEAARKAAKQEERELMKVVRELWVKVKMKAAKGGKGNEK